MKRLHPNLFVTLGLVLLLAAPLAARPAQREGNEGIILILASYNPDTRRMSSFITDFEYQIGAAHIPYQILIEDLGCKGISEAPQWIGKLDEINRRYAGKPVKAIILLGQEAWATFVSRDIFPDHIPVFGAFASQNGVLLPTPQTDLHHWTPAWIDMVEAVKGKGDVGGHLTLYDIPRNIDLIHSLYPSVKTIAFLSDNTYGGISLQALMRKEMAHYADFELRLIDSREGEEAAQKKVAELPQNSVILLGTWRVGDDGQYLTTNSLRNLAAAKPGIPIFTLTGSGMGIVAIGGYIPAYDSGAENIAAQIIARSKGHNQRAQFASTGSEYRFDRSKLQEYRIEEYKLPSGSIVTDRTEMQLRKYESYIYVLMVMLLSLFLFLLFLYLLYRRNRKLKSVLKSRNEELTTAKEHAEESDMLKSAFLANMSHEIRTPLNAIVGFSSLLGDANLSPDERLEYSSIVVKNSELLLTLIDDVLDISRMETGKIRFEYTREDIVQVCQQVMNTTTLNPRPGVEFEFRHDDVSSYLLYTDKQRLSQILINLMTNAIKFTERGRITLAFEIQPRQNRVLFTVTDTGCGIPKDLQTKVFNRFEKLQKSKQGTGLGLAICKQIAVNFGGDIWIDPDYTGGARFCFAHPINRDADARGGEFPKSKK